MSPKALLLTHGFLSDFTDFTNIIDCFEDYDYISYAHYPGHGTQHQESDYIKFNAQETLQYVLDDFDKLYEKCQTIDCVGYSMGGALATYIASCRPVNRLILIAPANHYLNARVSIDKTKFIASNLHQIRLHKDEDARKMYRELITNSFIDDKTGVKFFIKKYFRPYILKAYNELKRTVKGCNAKLTTLSIPTLIMWGKLDQLVPKSSVDYLYSICTNEKSKLIIYDNYSHLMMNSIEPKFIIDDITAFLEETDEQKV